MVKRLLLLNGLAALGVAIHHASAYGFSAMFEWTNRYRPVGVPNYDQLGGLTYYVLLIGRQLDVFVIPAFIFVSGFFIAFAAGGRRSTLNWDVVIARVKKFLVPFILWTAFRYALLKHPPHTVDDLFRPYYFIVLLTQLYLLSPLLVPIARNHWKSFLVISALIQIGAESLFFLSDIGIKSPGLAQMKSLFPLWFFPRRNFWFALGIVVGFRRQQFTAWLTKIKWELLASVIILAALTIVEYELFAYLTGQKWLGPSFRGITSWLYALAFILCFLAFDDVSLPFSKQISEIGGKSLGIYLANIPIIYIIAVMMYHYLPWILGNQLLYQIVLVTVGLAGPLVLMSALSRPRTRGVYHYVFG